MVVDPRHNKIISAETGRLKAKKRTYTVWVVPNANKQWQPYFCPDCRFPIFKYKGDSIMESPGGAPQTFPIEVACQNHKCGRKIRIEGASEQMM